MTSPRTKSTEDEIRRVALAMFSATGYDGTSVRAIAKRVGIRAVSLYNHFSSKEEIHGT
jgi:AcrR family transcriptional regulator